MDMLNDVIDHGYRSEREYLDALAEVDPFQGAAPCFEQNASYCVEWALTDLPEPEMAYRTDYHSHTSTPWGPAQSATHVTRGIVRYSTAGHGGFHVSAGLLKQMPEYMQKADKYADGTAGWFEEDCAWSLVVLTFPQFFTLQARMDALDTVRSIYPQVYTEYCRPA